MFFFVFFFHYNALGTCIAYCIVIHICLFQLYIKINSFIRSNNPRICPALTIAWKKHMMPKNEKKKKRGQYNDFLTKY